MKARNRIFDLHKYYDNSVAETCRVIPNIQGLVIEGVELLAIIIFPRGQSLQISKKRSIRRIDALISTIGATSWCKGFHIQTSGEYENCLSGHGPLVLFREIARRFPFDLGSTYLKASVSLVTRPISWSRQDIKLFAL